MKYTKLFLGLVIMATGISVYAADDSQSGKGGGHHHHPEMTDAQKACFTDNGLTAPGAGAPPKERPEKATLDKVHACLEKNGMTHFGPPRGEHGGDQNGGPGGPPPEGSSEGSSTSSSTNS